MNGIMYANVSSHALYIDDIMLFCKRDTNYIQVIASFLIKYVECLNKFLIIPH